MADMRFENKNVNLADGLILIKVFLCVFLYKNIMKTTQTEQGSLKKTH